MTLKSNFQFFVCTQIWTQNISTATWWVRGWLQHVANAALCQWVAANNIQQNVLKSLDKYKTGEKRVEG